MRHSFYRKVQLHTCSHASHNPFFSKIVRLHPFRGNSLTRVKLFPRVAPGGLYVIEDVETNYWDGPGAFIYGYGLQGVGVGRRGSIMESLKMMADVINHRYAVKDYKPGFHVIDAGVDPDVAWIAFAQNMVMIRKKDAEDRAYEVPISNMADGSAWKAFWVSADVRGVLGQVGAWKC